MALLVIAIVMGVLGLALSPGLTCLLIGHFINEPIVKKYGIWLLFAFPLSLFLLFLYWIGRD